MADLDERWRRGHLVARWQGDVLSQRQQMDGCGRRSESGVQGRHTARPLRGTLRERRRPFVQRDVRWPALPHAGASPA